MTDKRDDERDDGGPAFPMKSDPQPTEHFAGPNANKWTFEQPGMSLLDHWAGQLAAASWANWGSNNSCAEWAYDMAEALLDEKRRRENDAI
ncbi:MAG: hypothetical protein ACXADY_26345 [Candidatus Hodarchaeales archaeon]|jgi:hypothetical protein